MRRTSPLYAFSGGSEYARLLNEPKVLAREAEALEREIEQMCLENYHVHIQNGACVADARNEVCATTSHGCSVTNPLTSNGVRTTDSTNARSHGKIVRGCAEVRRVM